MHEMLDERIENRLLGQAPLHKSNNLSVLSKNTQRATIGLLQKDNLDP